MLGKSHKKKYLCFLASFAWRNITGKMSCACRRIGVTVVFVLCILNFSLVSFYVFFGVHFFFPAHIGSLLLLMCLPGDMHFFFHWWELPTVWSIGCCELRLLFCNTNLWYWFQNHTPLWESDSLAWVVLWRNSGWSRTVWFHLMQTCHKLFSKLWYTSFVQILSSLLLSFLLLQSIVKRPLVLLLWKFMFLFLANSFDCDSILFHLLQKESLASLESNNLAIVAIASCLYSETHSLWT